MSPVLNRWIIASGQAIRMRIAPMEGPCTEVPTVQQALRNESPVTRPEASRRIRAWQLHVFPRNS